MQNYVVGFVFDINSERVALIRKNRPNWQAGRLNGIGGKVEEGESPSAAMHRECKEEAGLDVHASAWGHFGILFGSDFRVHCFRATVSTREFDGITSLTDEVVEKLNLADPADLRMLQTEGLSNVPGLVFSAMDADSPFLTLAYRETIPLAKALASGETPEPAVSEASCSNWLAIVRETEHLLDRRFRSHDGKVFTFYGIVHARDDYYYGMASLEHGRRLLSCVGSIEGHGYELLPETVSAEVW